MNKKKIPERMKNPWFWIGIVSVALSAIGVDPQTFTSWQEVGQGLLSVLNNPVQLCTVCLAILSVFVDPTTPGIKDFPRNLELSKHGGE